MQKTAKKKQTAKQKQKKTAQKQKKAPKKTEKTRIRLDLKLVKYYYNYYSYNCNPFWISRQS